MNGLVYIYGLADPRTDEIRYVGKTIDPKERLREHLKDRRRTYRNNWIASLKALRLVPRMEILEKTDEEHWAGVE